MEVQMKRFGKQVAVVSQAHLEGVVSAIQNGGGTILHCETKFSRRRRHGLKETRVVTVLTYSGGVLQSQNPAVFKPHKAPTGTCYSNHFDFRTFGSLR